MRDCLPGHECIAVSDGGWKGIKNGELLRLAEGQFDLLLTERLDRRDSRTCYASYASFVLDALLFLGVLLLSGRV